MGKGKELSQAGLNRVIWHLLKTQPDGRFTINENVIDLPNPEDVIRIDYDPSIKSFTLSAIKVKADKPSMIIQPGRN